MISSQPEPHAADSAGHPLGPLLYRYFPVQRTAARRRALLVAAACAAVLGVALWLTPDPRGLGTHTQLGMIRCSWPATLGIPCPTCGMTTAFALTVRGRLVAAALAQPMGLLLCLLTIVILVLALREAWTLRAVRVNWYRVRPRYVITAAVVLTAAAWGYKILAFRAMLR